MIKTAFFSSWSRVFFAKGRETYSVKYRCQRRRTAVNSLILMDSSRSLASQQRRPSHKPGDSAASTPGVGMAP